MSPFRIEIVSTSCRLAEIGPAWSALRRAADGSVFQSHAWVSAWWHARPPGHGGSLRVALAWDGQDLVAVMPLVLRRRRGLRTLEWAAKECSDYCDVLTLPGSERDGAVEALWEAVSRQVRFDLAYLGHLQPGSATLRGLGRGSGTALVPNARRQTNLRLRPVQAGGTAWFESLPKKLRQNYRRGWKTLSETGAARFRLLGTEEAVGPALDRLVALKRAWLARTGQHSPVLEKDAACLRAVTGVLAGQGLLRAFVIERDGEIVAGTLNFVEGGALRALFAAYDHEMEKASVGTLLMIDYIQWAIDLGLTEIDFLAGAEPYKLKFADTQLDLVSLAGAGTWRGRLALAADRWLSARRARRDSASAPGDPQPAPNSPATSAGRSQPTWRKPPTPAAVSASTSAAGRPAR